MNNYEFISYKQYAQDQYTAASCKIRIDKRFVVSYFQKKMKDGGLFWTAASAQVMDNDGQKQYITGFMLDSQMESEMLIEFIKENVKRVTASTTPQQASLGAGQVYTRSDAGVYPPLQSTLTKEVAADEPLPF